MFKPKHIAPFFSMTPIQFSEVLREIHIVYPLSQTAMGSFLLTENDLPVIELYLKTKHFFGNKKITRIQLKEWLDKKEGSQEETGPEWIHMIKNKT